MEKLIGHCAVDSGQILLIDPCYVYEDNFTPDSDPTGGAYDECCRITLSEKRAGQTSNLGVVTGTYYGDGSYPVYADMDSNGRVRSVTIFFDGQMDEDEDEDEWEDDEDEDEEDWG